MQSARGIRVRVSVSLRINISVSSSGVRVSHRTAIDLVFGNQHYECPRVKLVGAQVEVQVLVAVMVQYGVEVVFIVGCRALSVSANPVINDDVGRWL